MAPSLASMKRIVIKIGSALIADIDRASVHMAWLKGLADDIAALRAKGCEVVVVSSGAVALGRPVLGLGHKSLELTEKQAAAACGQIQLMQAWQHALAPHHLHAAQVLLTLDDSENRKRYLNARATFETLLARGLVPVVNENDTVTTAEIRFGDNDRLAARVAAMISADCCILFSDIDGLYTQNPKLHHDAAHIPEVTHITADIEAMAAGPASSTSSGGMITKIIAAKMATEAGCHLVITRGDTEHPLSALSQGAKATWFMASGSPMGARKQWIAGSMSERGAVIIDDGAARALADGKSLLPSGVKALEGTFERGDTVLIKTQSGSTIGKGISAYDADEAQRILGVHSEAIASILGYSVRDTIIHRDDMVML
ncbi:MAG: glutamate 5-kinase [Alphaproteobacteria bacterium]|nr:glutamate 5-kinase [Alphaproteobacteria bacterium]